MKAAAKPGGQIDPKFVEGWADRYLEAWNALDADAVAQMCSAGVTWIDPSLQEPARGREGVRSFVRTTAEVFPDFRIEDTGPHHISAAESKVLSPYRMTGTMLGGSKAVNFAPTGARISVTGVDEWTFRDGLLYELRTYYDAMDVARQLGILPPMGSRGERAMARLQQIQARFQRRKARHSPR